MLKTVCIDNLQQFAQLESDWNALVSSQPDSTIFLRHEWLYTWFEHFGNSRRLYVLQFQDGEDTVGFAPLMISTRSWLGWTKRVVEFIGSPDSDYSDFIGKDRDRIIEGTFAYLSEHSGDWDQIQLTQLSDRSVSLNYLSQSIIPRFRGTCVPSDTCYQYRYTSDPNERTSVKLCTGRTFRKIGNFFNKRGGYELKRIDDLDQARKTLGQIQLLHINRWRDTDFPSLFEDRCKIDFYEKVLERLWPSGSICLMKLTNRDVPVAAILSFEHRGWIHYYTVAHNQFFNRRSPGRFLYALQSETLVRQGYDLDFSRGAGFHKEKIANTSSVNFTVTIYRSRVSCWAALLYSGIKKMTIVRKLLQTQLVQSGKNRFLLNLRRHGPIGLPIYLLRRLVFGPPGKGLSELYLAPAISPTTAEPVDLATVTKDHLDMVATVMSIDGESFAYEHLTARHALAENCFMVGDITLPEAIAWVDSDAEALKKLGLLRELKDNERLVSSIWVSPLHDRHDLVEQLLIKIASRLHKEDKRLLVVAERSDLPTVQVLNEAGFQRIVRF